MPTSHSRRSLHALALAVCLLLPALRAEADDCTDPGLSDPFACRELLVEYTPASFDVDAFNAAYGTVVEVDIPELEVMQVLAPDEATRELIEENGFPGVEDTRVNSKLLSPECRQRVIALIELGHVPGHLSGQDAMSAIRAPEAWALGDGAGVLVAVADTGVDAAHPALAGKVAAGGLDLIDADGDPSEEANGIDDDNDGLTDPGYGHGTAIASLISTLAPGAAVLPIRITDDECRTSAMLVAKALVEASKAGAQVVNLSLGMLDDHRYVDKALRYARDRGVLVVVSTGNSGDKPGEYPSRETGVLSVAASDHTGVKTLFSSWGSDVDLVAPGADLLGAYPEEQYARVEGSSYAAALASGVAALALGAQPCSAAPETFALLTRTARSVDGLAGNAGEPWEGKLGSGLPDAAAVVVPGVAMAPLAGLQVVKADAARLLFLWTSHTEPGSQLGARVSSVATRTEIPRASSNTALCPDCPAASLLPRCETAEAAPGRCEESAPGVLLDPARTLYFQAVELCQGVEGAL